GFRSEVPNCQVERTAWPSAPPATDLFDRLVVPAAGFRLVPGSFRLGHLLFVCQFPMGKGHHDPLAVVAPASVFQFARLLQRLDAPPPGARAVLGPTQKLPAHSRGEFDGLLDDLDRPPGIAELRVRAVDQVPTLVPQGLAELDTGFGAFRIEFDGPAVG